MSLRDFRIAVTVCLTLLALTTAAQTRRICDDGCAPEANRALSKFRFIDAESAAPVKPRSVQIDGHELAEFVAGDGSLHVESDPGDHYVVVVADGYRELRAFHFATAPRSTPNTFHLLAEARLPGFSSHLAAAPCRISGWVRAADDHRAIESARVTFESPAARAEVQTDASGAYCIPLPDGAFEGEWRLSAEAEGLPARTWTGEGSGEVPEKMTQAFLLFSPDARETLPRQIAVLPGDSQSAVESFAAQAAPNSIRVGLGAPLSTAQACSGMNAKCTSSFNACTGGVDTVDTELYVKRVFRGELFGTTIWNEAQLDNFKAMAVAIRSYASYRALNNRRGSQYDICNSDSCQCYFSGFNSFGSVSTDASNQTAGQLMLNASGVIGNTEYGSWNGACAQGIIHCNAEGAYPNVLPIYDWAIDQNYHLKPSNSTYWGHGRGLSQYGSHFRAKAGETYGDILKFYYADYGWTLNAAATVSPPAAPSGLSSVALSSSSIKFSWADNSSNETNFLVYRWNGTSWVQIATVGANTTSYTDTGLQASTAYAHTVCARNSAGTNCASNYSSATTQGGSTGTVPAAPSGLSATALSSSSIKFSWADNSNNETNFLVYRWNGTTWVQIATAGANVTNYTDSGLQASTTYTYTVCSRNSVGTNCASTYTYATTQSGNTVTPPLAPTGLSATALSSSSIKFSWADNSNNETSFLVYRWNGTTWVQIATAGANITSYTDSGLQASTTYTYTVCSKNSAGTNCASTYTYATTQSGNTVTMPVAPNGLSATALSSSSIKFSWVDNSNNEANFLVYRWNGTTWAQIAIVGANVTSYTDSGLQASTTYYYTVCARNSAGTNCAATYGSVTTNSSVTTPTAPGSLNAVARSSSSIEFSWVDNSGNEANFLVYRWNGTAWVQIGTVGANVTKYTDTGLQPSTAYYYTVCAQNSAGTNCAATYASATTSTSVTIPAAPASLSAGALSSSSILFWWADRSNNESRFLVYRWNGTAWVQIATVGANVTSYTNTGLISKGTYYYTVCAQNSAGTSCASTYASATTF